MVPADRQSVRAHVQELFQEQVERARGERTAPNEPAPGDAAARNCFWELLSAPEQRHTPQGHRRPAVLAARAHARGRAAV